MVKILTCSLEKREDERASAGALLNHPWILSRAGKANLRELVERMQMA
jgi:hypothetical protein